MIMKIPAKKYIRLERLFFFSSRDVKNPFCNILIDSYLFTKTIQGRITHFSACATLNL